ncbi:hypothetical protein D3C71_79630 [compost metagenome]
MNVETKEYPMFLAHVRLQLQNVSFSATPDEEDLAQHGFAVVYPTDMPEVGADVVDEGQPALSGGKYVQTWLPRWYTPEEKAAALEVKKEQLVQELKALQEATLIGGVPYLFPDINAIQHIQLRGGDRANLTGLANKADRNIAAGKTDLMFFRTFENELRVLTPQQMYDMTDKSLELYMLILSQVWTLQGQIQTAATEAELPDVPESLITSLPAQ